MSENEQEEYPRETNTETAHPSTESSVVDVSVGASVPWGGGITRGRVSDEQWQAFTERVKEANPIEGVVGLDAALERRGDELVCSSPLRSDDDSPSFAVSVPKQLWLDRGTGKGGDVVAYVMDRHGLSFVEARRMLAERAGVPQPTGTAPTAADQDLADERRRVESILTDAANAYHEALDDERRAFLRTHYGFTDPTINDGKLGFDPGGTHLWYGLKAKGHQDEHLFQTGLFIERSSTLGATYFHDRFTFPYWRRGRVVYFWCGGNLGAPPADAVAEEAGHEGTAALAVSRTTAQLTTLASFFPSRPTRTVRARVVSARLEPWPPPDPCDDAWPPSDAADRGRLVVQVDLVDGSVAHAVLYAEPLKPDTTFDGLRAFGWDGARDHRGHPILQSVELAVSIQTQFQLGFGDVATVVAVGVVGASCGSADQQTC
jgi:hypothetical protein